MGAERYDFLLREISRLRLLAAALLNDHDDADADQVLELALRLQVQLFPLPAPEFLALDAATQFETLIRGLAPAAAAEKVLTYSELLVHAASAYDAQGRTDFALGARQLALHHALLAALRLEDEAAASTVALLRRSLAGEQLHGPVQELATEFDRAQGLA
jgi:hypothetical protein